MANKLDCITCKKAISRTKKGVNCSLCTNVYHISCGQIPDTVFKAIENGTSDWRCLSCRNKAGRKSMVLDSTEVNDADSDDVAIDQTNLNTAIKKLQQNMNSLRQNYQASMDSMITMNQQLTDLQSIVTTVNEHDNKIKILVKDNHTMRTAIIILTICLDNIEQSNHRNKVQLNGIPETVGENLHTIVINVGNKMGIKLFNDDIIEVKRIQPPRKLTTGTINNQVSDTADTSSSSIVPPPANIADANSVDVDKSIYGSVFITFKSSHKRNEILTVFRKLPEKELFFDNDKKFKIYFTEYLSSNRRRLFTKAKLFAKLNDVKFVWVNNGNILMKKREGEKVVRINSQTDFSSIFEMEATADLG